MAEIFGIIAGVAGIADVGIKVSRRLHKVASEWKNAPDEILALGREVSDLTVVMHNIQDACRSIQAAPSASPGLVANLRTTTDRAGKLLNEIDDAVWELTFMTTRKFERRAKWLVIRPSLEQKRQGLRDLRVNIRDLLLAQGM